MSARWLDGARRRRRALSAFAACAAVVGLAACAGGPFEDGRARAVRIAAEAGFTPAHVDGGPFTLYSAYRGRRGDDRRLVVYIEGDGLAWQNRYVQSPDPTPVDPVGLELAARERAPMVVYIARPCQFARDEDGRPCPPRYWSTHRYAPEVIEATSRVIDHYRAMLGASEVELVGYSGGGAVAVLLAALRSDVAALTTVAATLDHRAWTAHHGVTPMDGSLNPADYAAALAELPQLHLVGGDDSVVPSLVADAYLAHMGEGAHGRLIRIDDFGHDCCWVRQWPELRAKYRRLLAPGRPLHAGGAQPPSPR